MIKNDIVPLEHLYVLTAFTVIVCVLVSREDTVKYYIKNLETNIGWNDNNNALKFEPYVQRIAEWLIADYKASKCRRWIRKLKVNTRRIFSSFK